MIVASTAASSSSGAPGVAMSLVAMASIVAGSAIFLALIAMVAHASYLRKKEYNLHVAEWHQAESDALKRKERFNKEMLH